MRLQAGGRLGQAGMLDGEIIKSVRQVRPQLEPQQVKALLSGSPKLLKAVQDGAQGPKLLEKILHEERRQGLVPKLGLRKEPAEAKQQENNEGWSKVGKGGKKQHMREEVKTLHRTMQLHPAQIVCEGRPVQVREALLHGYGGVCIVQNKNELLKLAKLYKSDDQTPQVAVAAMRRVQPRSLRVEGEDGAKDAVTRCCIYPLSKKKVHIVHAQEHSRALVAKETLKVQANAAIQCGK
eukprot:2305939-Amphidinium_carterae.1